MRRWANGIPFWKRNGYKQDPYPFSSVMAHLALASASLDHGMAEMCETYLDKALDSIRPGMDNANELSLAICDAYAMKKFAIDKAYYIALQLRDEKCGEIPEHQREAWHKSKVRRSKEFTAGIVREKANKRNALKRQTRG